MQSFFFFDLMFHSDLSLNFLSGPIPREWASLPLTHLYVASLSLSYKREVLEIKMQVMTPLPVLIRSVMGNRISGTIPKEFGGMTKLTSL